MKKASTKTQGIQYPEREAIFKRLYDVNEASVYLGRKVWSVRNLINTGKIPYVQDGRRKLLDIKDMDNWIERNKTRNFY
jgi:excisionase family DNA binding protein